MAESTEMTLDLDETSTVSSSICVDLNNAFLRSDKDSLHTLEIPSSPLKENQPVKTSCARKLFSTPLVKKDFFDIVHKQLSQCKSFKQLQRVCEDLTPQIMPYPINIDKQTILKNRLHVDKHALQQLPQCKPQGLLPVLTIGDGNCMARAISTIVFGSGEHHKEIRCRIIHELVTLMKDYLDDSVVSSWCELEVTKVFPLIA